MLMSTRHGNAGNTGIKTTSTEHVRVVGSCTGCLKVHDNDQSPSPLGRSLAKCGCYHTEVGLWGLSQRSNTSCLLILCDTTQE